MGIKLKDISGQMTVEFAVAFPVMLAIGLVATNALLFFSECAAFDRIAQEAIREHASSPAYEQTIDQSAALVEQEIACHFERDYLDTSVEVSQSGSGQACFVAQLNFSPNIFGMGVRSEVFGVSLPQLKHSTSLVLSPYKPGVLL
ncbi:MAG: TadE/TadG family type IV pilus assembly protein [Raoultibacter sp.]|jgi:hypothetical protein